MREKMNEVAFPAFSKKYRAVLAAGALALVIASGVFLVFASQNQTNGADEVARITAAVGKHVQLPANETPTLATVKDLSKLTGQSFFAHAQVGDKVLLYIGARTAILYRPKTDTVIEVAPLTEAGIRNTP